MKRLLIAALAATALTPVAAMADTLSIAVGQPGRGYEAKGVEIAQRLQSRKIEADVVNYEGSDDISIAVCGGDAEVGIVQIDAIYTRSKEGCNLQVLATYGSEYAFILFPPDSRLNELTDLDAEHRILVDTLGSGTDLFWHTILDIEAEHGNGSSWSKATAVNGLSFMADAMAAAGEIDAAMIVGNPNSPEIIELIDAGWNPGELQDKDINDLVYNRKSLYERESVKIGRTGFMRGSTEDAYVVPSFIVANTDWMAANRRDFQSVARAAK